MKELNNDDTLIIIPSYNEGKKILEVVNAIKDNFHYIVINDGSYDMTDDILLKNNINNISNSHNLGLSQSMRVGIEWAILNNFKYCIQFDGDGQHDIKTINKMLDYRRDYNIVLTTRFNKHTDYKNNPLNKRIIWKLFSFIIKIKSNVNISDPTCGLRLYDISFMKKYLADKKLKVEPSTICRAIKKWNMKIIEIPTIVKKREYGESKFHNIRNQIKYLTEEFLKIIFL
ncbi:MAG: glycosyltransferase family 2 protein [Mycoplasmoidaceae bacterium]